MKHPHIKNWKLREIIKDVEIIAEDSIEERNELLVELNLPEPATFTGLNREETNIDWSKMPSYYKFFFDKKGWEEKIEKWLEQSVLTKSDRIIITYGWKEPMVSIPTKLFIADWEGFIKSTLWETIIFSTDYKLIMEVSRDYYLHSNFEIMPNSKVF